MKRLKKRKEELQVILVDAITSLAGVIDAKDPYTIGHSKRVAEYALQIGTSMGLKDEDLVYLQFSALLHDIGKIGVPDNILNKKGKLSEDEFLIVKQHPVKGAKILEQTTSLRFLGLGVRYHHERYDGNGYCSGIKGNDIPLYARIITIADSYDAMTQNRPYRKALSHEDAVKEIHKCTGTQFDPYC